MPQVIQVRPSASFSSTLRIKLPSRPGTLGLVATAIGGAGGDIGTIDIVHVGSDSVTRDITFDAASREHSDDVIAAVRMLGGIDVLDVSDRTFLMHVGGKIEVVSKRPVRTSADLSMAYTPGVARVCQAIHDEPSRAFTLTIKQNTVAVVSDGSAVLGLGDIGPAAALPVMEGKAMLFKEFAGVNAFPICLATRDPDEIVRTVAAISPAFGGINLEDIAAPRCFEIEERLQEQLDIPVFHDDQHGTAVVILAALLNALKLVGKRMADIKVVVSGVGAAGVASTKMLMAAGVQDIIGCDQAGALYAGRPDRMNRVKEWYARHTNPGKERGTIHDVIRGADLFIGLSVPRLVTRDDISWMAPHPIVFAMANPVPEIMPEETSDRVGVMATGRSDYPNQINNVLCFPGMFRGVLACRAARINEAMKLAAAQAIAGVVSENELDPEYIVPSVFDRRVVEAVAQAVEAAAFETGVARGVPAMPA